MKATENKHPKHNKIKKKLLEGLTVKQVSKSLHVSTVTVQSIRAMYPDEFKKRGELNERDKSVRVAEIKHSIFSRVSLRIYNRFQIEMKRSGLTISGLLQHILSERYPFGPDDHLNDFEIQDRCKCPDDSKIKNCNSNRDQDEVVCRDCGRVESGGVDDSKSIS